MKFDGFAACEFDEIGKYGEFITQAYCGDGSDAIAALLPPSSVVAVLSRSDDVFGEYARRLRRKGIIARKYDGESIDDVRMIVALGSSKEADEAKLHATERKLPVFVTVTAPDAVTALGGHCYRTDPFDRRECVVPVGVAVADDLMKGCGELPASFGSICATSVAACDSEAFMRAVGKSPDSGIRAAAVELAFSALDVAEKYTRDWSELPAMLARIAVKCALLSQISYGDISRGSPDDCARTAAVLLKRENRREPRRGECAFIFGSVLSRLYCSSLFCGSDFVPPPDNNLRAERMTEYLGLDELTATRCTVSKIKNIPLVLYRLREYRDELELALSDACSVFDEGSKCFRRLFADDGYEMRSFFDCSDIRTVIALAPDSRPVSLGALTLMREFGLLDRYL